VVLVGDRIHDVEGAAIHGVDSVLVQWGYGTEDEWSEATATAATVEGLREFLGV
jgi:phosphoglycolate phosphatase